MALTFQLFTDAALTTPLGGGLVSDHLVTGSPNDQFTLYLGSTAASKKLEATSNPGVDQVAVSVVPTVAAWAAATAKSVGNIVRPTVHNGYRYRCTVAGTTAGSQPTWPTTVGLTVVDGGVTWVCDSEINDVTDWKLAATLGGLAGATWGAGLNLGTVINSGSANAKAIWLEARDSTAYVQNTDFTLTSVNVRETAQ